MRIRFWKLRPLERTKVKLSLLLSENEVPKNILIENKPTKTVFELFTDYKNSIEEVHDDDEGQLRLVELTGNLQDNLNKTTPKSRLDKKTLVLLEVVVQKILHGNVSNIIKTKEALDIIDQKTKATLKKEERITRYRKKLSSWIQEKKYTTAWCLMAGIPLLISGFLYTIGHSLHSPAGYVFWTTCLIFTAVMFSAADTETAKKSRFLRFIVTIAILHAITLGPSLNLKKPYLSYHSGDRTFFVINKKSHTIEAVYREDNRKIERDKRYTCTYYNNECKSGMPEVNIWTQKIVEGFHLEGKIYIDREEGYAQVEYVIDSQKLLGVNYENLKTMDLAQNLEQALERVKTPEVIDPNMVGLKKQREATQFEIDKLEKEADKIRAELDALNKEGDKLNKTANDIKDLIYRSEKNIAKQKTEMAIKQLKKDGFLEKLYIKEVSRP